MDAGYAVRPSADSIAEFRSLAATAPAEFGGTNGGVTALVTRSSTNALRGTLSDFFRNNALDKQLLRPTAAWIQRKRALQFQLGAGSLTRRGTPYLY